MESCITEKIAEHHPRARGKILSSLHSQTTVSTPFLRLVPDGAPGVAAVRGRRRYGVQVMRVRLVRWRQQGRGGVRGRGDGRHGPRAHRAPRHAHSRAARPVPSGVPVQQEQPQPVLLHGRLVRGRGRAVLEFRVHHGCGREKREEKQN
jgi:hypothetical protein